MRIRRQLRRYGDYAIALAVGVVYLGEVALESDVEHRGASAAMACAFAASLLLRRRVPMVALLVGLAVIELDNTVLKGLAETGAFLVGFVIALYSAGRYARGPMAVACALLVLAAIPLAAIEPGQPVGFADFAFFAMFFGGPIAAGRVIRFRREREHALVDHAAALELERDTKAREAVAEERTRIARDLHDVVAHAISVMILQARGGRRMLPDHPGETLEALGAIEHAGEQALTEMRRLLGMLRSDDDQPALAPQPSLERIGELADRLMYCGVPKKRAAPSAYRPKASRPKGLKCRSSSPAVVTVGA